jgi:hypothetical protein
MATPTVVTPPNYKYLGCYADTPRRILDAAGTNIASMTISECDGYCNGAISLARFYPYIGVEAGY